MIKIIAIFSSKPDSVFIGYEYSDPYNNHDYGHFFSSGNGDGNNRNYMSIGNGNGCGFDYGFGYDKVGYGYGREQYKLLVINRANR